MLGSMKSVKMMGLTTMMTETIQSQREREIRLGSAYRWSNVWLNVVGKSEHQSQVMSFTNYNKIRERKVTWGSQVPLNYLFQITS